VTAHDHSHYHSTEGNANSSLTIRHHLPRRIAHREGDYRGSKEQRAGTETESRKLLAGLN
jgi:hypothetical protein